MSSRDSSWYTAGIGIPGLDTTERESRTRRTANRFSTAARLCLKPTKAIGPAWQVAAFLFNFFLHLSVMFFNFLCSGQFIPSAVS